MAMETDQLWQRLVDAVAHMVLSERYAGAKGEDGFNKCVPNAFETFHVQIGGQDDVSKAMERAWAHADQGLHIGVVQPKSATGGAQDVLLEVWTIEREALAKGMKMRRGHDGATAFRVLLRVLLARLKTLPLGLMGGRQRHRAAGIRKQRGFFLAPLTAYDYRKGAAAMPAGKHIYTRDGDELTSAAQFEELTKRVTFPSIHLPDNGSGARIPTSFTVSVVYAVTASETPEAAAAADSAARDAAPSFAIIGDYVNSGGAQGGEWEMPFSRPKHGGGGGAPPPALSAAPPARPDSTGRQSDGHVTPTMRFTNRTQSRSPSATAAPVALPPANRSFGPAANPQHTTASIPIKASAAETPPPFALTPTMSSLHSNGSWNHHPAGAVLMQQHASRVGMGVSPPDGGAHQWAPRVDAGTTGTWAPKGRLEGDATAAATAAVPSQDISPFMAFLEEDEQDILLDAASDDGLDAPAPPTLHTDDEVSRFREKMEAVTLSDGFPSRGTLASSSSPFTSSFIGAGPAAGGDVPHVARTLADVRTHLDLLKAGFRSLEDEAS
eukprot:TRINITY_DN22837_c0_g1_i1.p1 TRINITY_DN22837_c0_g1~~TRINITY_DN22837_c0_g1_i1.p1  ORF type:complete len:552 (+),score=189.12 TRINITY_DN22837_c0_g1_i1:95-1750(+)